MNIAILGAGNVGGALGRRWAGLGHAIFYGVREPQAEKYGPLLAATGHDACANSMKEACARASIIALATPWSSVPEVLQASGDLTGKIIIDCTNPLTFRPGVGLELALGFSDSGAETIARLTPGARVVKAFNTYGWENFADPHYPNPAQLRPLMFLAADDAEAKATVALLASATGFDPFDAGDLRAARELEPLALLWIRRATSGERSADFTWARLQRGKASG